MNTPRLHWTVLPSPLGDAFALWIVRAEPDREKEDEVEELSVGRRADVTGRSERARAARPDEPA